MRVSEYFGLGRTQPHLDFVDVRLDTDVPLFVNPSAIRALPSAWGSGCVSLLQHFFDLILRLIKARKEARAVELLASLRERNEFHLGYSQERSRGRAMGPGSAKDVWDALVASKAAKSALLKDLEETCLMIRGVGADIVSDATCNVIRGPLIRYTQDMCGYYGIPLTPDVASGPVWNPAIEDWEQSLVPLPMTSLGRVILVPKIIVRFKTWFEPEEYYRHYLLPELQREELANPNSSLVRILKDGRRRVTKKALMERYGSDKLAIVNLTIPRQRILEDYREVKRQTGPAPLRHRDIASAENTSPPDWSALALELKAIPPGLETSGRYEEVIEKFLTALFYPSLSNPVKQQKIHEGRKRIDITYVNVAQVGFFSWLAQHYPAAHIFVECKNYGSEVANPELDQLSGRFSPSRGRVGLLISRKIADRSTLSKRCRDTAVDDRGYILAMDDEDIVALLDSRAKGTLGPEAEEEFPNLRSLFDQLVM